MNTLKEFLGKATKALSLFICLWLFPSLEAQARFNVEPFYRKYSGDFKRNSQKGSISGDSTGMNLGYIGDYFLAGVSMELGNFTYSDHITDQGYTHFRGGGIGTYLGFHFYDRVKLWTGYLNSSIEPKSNDKFRYYGQQVSFGLGVRVWDYILLNYEVFSNYFTQYEDDETGKTGGLDSNIRTNMQAFGISAFLIF